MSISTKNNRIRKVIMIAIIAVLGIFMAILEWFPISFSQDVWYNKIINKTLQQTSGITAVVLILCMMDIKLFGKIHNWLYFLPCILVALNNFQWYSYFKGMQQLVRINALDIMLFALYCLSVGLFEEFVFRGILFSVLASYFPDNKKGLIETFIVSSLIFGGAHLFNLNVLQAGYSILTGGLFAFVLIKTKNLFCCGFAHGLYNFCGMLMETSANLGLGNGVKLFNLGTILCMAILGVAMGVFVLYFLIKYPEEERKALYKFLSVPEKTEKEPQDVENGENIEE